MTGFLIKTLLLLLVAIWTLRKFLEWASRMEGPYGKLAADFLRLLNEFSRGLSRTILWALIAILALLLSRRALTHWAEQKPPPAREVIEKQGVDPR